MKEYIYCADTYCEDCGAGLAAKIPFPAGADPDNESTWDSDQYPKGPYTVSEADTPQHCACCHVFLQNSLTDDGDAYVRQAVEDMQAVYPNAFKPDMSWEEIAQSADMLGQHPLAEWIRYYFAWGQ